LEKIDTNIDFFNFSKMLSGSRKELVGCLERCLEHGNFILGSEVELFEDIFSRKVGSKYCVGVSNGTDALTAILTSLDLPPGSEVIVPAFTFISSASVISKAGLTPVFVDLAPGSFSPSVDGIMNSCTGATKAVIFVHLFGEYSDLSSLSAACRDRGIHLIEDCAQSYGAPNGSFGIASSFSFFPAKNLGCLGDGGAVTTGDGGVDQRLRMIRKHGMSSKYNYEITGGNYRLDALQAAFLSVLIQKADEWIEKRRENARFYFNAIGDIENIVLPKKCSLHSFNQFTIRTSRRDDLKKFLYNNGIPSNIYYPAPLCDYSAFADSDGLLESRKTCDEVLSLPIYPGLKADELEYISHNINLFFNYGSKK